MAKITLNETLKHIQNNRKLKFLELDVKEMDRPEEEVETENIPSDEIHRMIRELPDGYRTIFNLYVIDGKSHKEIATLLHIKESSSASQLHRAKAILAEKIKQYKARYSSSL
jgi:RNA polymerase sigma-70 factor (ECF subfamily)